MNTMPLNYGQPKKHIARRIITITLSILALLLAVAVMLVWMFWDRLTAPNQSDVSSDPQTQYEEPLTSVDSTLVILDFPDVKRYLLVQSVPARNTIHVVNIPANLAIKETDTLSTLLEKHGSLRVTQAVSEALALPVNHYLTLSPSGAYAFLKDLERGVSYNLPEDVQYTDENGNSTRLKAGEQLLSGVQVSGVLRYNGWKSTSNENIAASIIAALINQYVVPNQRLDGYFAALADTAQTDLRIDNYNAFRRILTHLATNNNGLLCRVVTLIGTETDGRFIPDVDAMRSQTHLYS